MPKAITTSVSLIDYGLDNNSGPNDININYHSGHLGDFREIINKKWLFIKKAKNGRIENP